MNKLKKNNPTYTEQFKEIFDRINSDTGLIFVDTPEETRLIREVYKKFQHHSVEFWALNQGLHRIIDIDADKFLPHQSAYKNNKARTSKDKKIISNISLLNALSIIEEDCYDKITPENEIQQKTIYILRDAVSLLNQPSPLRTLRNLIYLCSCASSTLIISGFGITVPNDVSKDCAFIKLPYPTKDDIINSMIRELKLKIDFNNKDNNSETKIDPDFDEEALARACVGLTEDQILNVFQYTTTIDNKINIERVLEEKKAIISQSDILDFWICNDKMDQIGGFDAFKEWFSFRKTIIENPEAAHNYGASYPKGIMLLGMQGSGKTAMGKAAAQHLKVGLVKFEMGKVFAGIVGESEKRMRQALTQIEAAAPVVVLIDEIDKGMAGAGSSDRTDGGTTSRVIGTLLTWLQEPHPGVFLICTANDITAMLNNHPELLRKGRFDEIWFSDIPTAEEREEIIKIHLKKAGRDPEKFDTKALSKIVYTDDTDGKEYNYTGAEIEYAIADTLQERFAQVFNAKDITINDKTDITDALLQSKLAMIKPMEKVAVEKIRAMRNWAKDNARNVSTSSNIKKQENIIGTKSKLNMRNAFKNNECSI